MWSFLISLVALIAGYCIYGKVVDRIFGPDPSRKTPAITKADGVDYVPMPTWKVFLIQFLNIAGTGPIFGAIMGAKFGPSCYLWIVLGSIFAGGVHDYMTGMLSIRDGGATLPDIVGHHLGKKSRIIILGFSLILLLLVGVVFVYSPALILGDIAGFMPTEKSSIMMWVLLIFGYYIVATLLPIDKLIGKIYPVFAFALLFMAIGLCVCLFIKWPTIPEFWQGLGNRGPSVGLNGQAIFPCLFITVACGAISGFHSTQTPLMARCLKNEKLGRPIFYGAMITEGIVALIWAAVSSYFFFDGGMAEVGASSAQAPEVVTSVARSWLGIVGGILAILGVVAAPITSGDTAFRSARLTIAGFLHVDQKPIRNRFRIAIPIFIAASLLLWFNIADENGFNKIWRYFGLANQFLACVCMWMITAHFTRTRPNDFVFLLTLLPAVFLTSVCFTYVIAGDTVLNFKKFTYQLLGLGSAVIALASFLYYKYHVLPKKRKNVTNR
ncbi:MAG: carbon starvation protein A [Bacteroidales bacterium]|nr:carbon starvation protein A [Bacteroidales bacterium]